MMVVEWSEKKPAAPVTHTHVWGQWMTRNRSEYYRQCLIFNCREFETKKAPTA